MAFVFGTSSDDNLVGTSGSDIVIAWSGDDIINTGGGCDYVFAGSGDDTINSGAGNDLVYAGSGDDNVIAGSGNDVVVAGWGNDTVDGGSGNDWIFAGSGNDVVDAGAGSDFVAAGYGNDTLKYNVSERGEDDVDIYCGGCGNDTLQIMVTSAELAELQASLDDYQAHLAAGNIYEAFTFESLGLTVYGIENLDIVNTTPEPEVQVLTFDDIDLADGAEQPMPVGYGGFDWVQAGVYNPDGSIPGYQPSSGQNLGFVGEYFGGQVPGYEGEPGDPIQISRTDGADFSFVGADFGAAFRPDLEVTVNAYDDGVLVGSKAFTVGTSGHSSIAFEDEGGQRFSSIDELQISAADGGSAGLADDYFYVDNFAYSLAPIDDLIA